MNASDKFTSERVEHEITKVKKAEMMKKAAMMTKVAIDDTGSNDDN